MNKNDCDEREAMSLNEEFKDLLPIDLVNKHKSIYSQISLNMRNKKFLQRRLFGSLGGLVMTVQFTENTMAGLISIIRDLKNNPELFDKFVSELECMSNEELVNTKRNKHNEGTLFEIINSLFELGLIDSNIKQVFHKCRKVRNKYIHEYFVLNESILRNHREMVDVIVNIEFISYVLSDYLKMIGMDFLNLLASKSSVVKEKLDYLLTYYENGIKRT